MGSRRDRYLLGIDLGTESARAGIFDLEGRAIATAATTYELTHPRPGWAEQDPDEWWSALVTSVRERHGRGRRRRRPHRRPVRRRDHVHGRRARRLRAAHLRPAIMWMDVRASDQARRIGESSDPARKYNGGGKGPVSAEWLPSKLLWLKEKEHETYDGAAHLVDAPDWATFRLTGRLTANVNTAATRGFHDGDAGGWPTSFYEEIGLEDVFEKLPPDVVALGEHVEGLSDAAAEELGLKPGTPVAQGGGDAWVGQIGLNVVTPGRMALITGSSHVLIGQSDEQISGEGFFGAYTDAVIPGQYTVEGGQVSTGSVLKWFKDHFFRDATLREAEERGISPYDVLNERIADIPPGSDGLDRQRVLAGQPHAVHRPARARRDVGLQPPPHPRARLPRDPGGRLLRHRAHPALDDRRRASTSASSWPRAASRTAASSCRCTADVSGVPITFTEVGDAVVLGGAILAATGAGLFDSVPEAAARDGPRDRHDRARPRDPRGVPVSTSTRTPRPIPALRPLVHRHVRARRRAGHGRGMSAARTTETKEQDPT